jgi:cellulose synthase/poly-beta-1,6-N-acetylglucosamine synthase-like glycosyltransferase
VVRTYAHRGVELFRLPTGQQGAAENLALPRIRGEIVFNTDATIRILPESLKPLIRVFRDPSVGVASGRDVSVGDITVEATGGESGYVGYEMWVGARDPRNDCRASGCFTPPAGTCIDRGAPAPS